MGIDLLDNSFFRFIPKIELHNHLEGTITPLTLHELAKKNARSSIYASSLDSCKEIFQFNDFAGFLNSFSRVNKFISSVADLDIIMRNGYHSLKAENYKYVEYFLSIDTFMKKNLSLTDLLDRVKQNIKRLSSRSFIIGGITIDFVRNYGPANALQILTDLKPVLDDYRDILLGISIGGDEFNFPAPLFKDVFSLARDLGLKTTAHAGEVAGAQSIWDAIFILQTDRIGHGLRTYESPDLIKHFRATQTVLEMCPTSNVCTNVIDTIDHHPIANYYAAGLNITVNTDDAGFFNCSLTGELELCHRLFGFSRDDIYQLIINAASGSFLPYFQRMELIEDVKNLLNKIN